MPTAMGRSRCWVLLDDPSAYCNFWGMLSAKRRGPISVSDAWKGASVSNDDWANRLSSQLQYRHDQLPHILFILCRPNNSNQGVLHRRESEFPEDFLQSSGYRSSSLFHSYFHSLTIRMPGSSSPTLAMKLSPPGTPSLSLPFLASRSGLSYSCGERSGPGPSMKYSITDIP